MKVTAKNEITRLCSPGDIVTITGIFMPTSFYGRGRYGLHQDTFLDAFSIVKDKENFRETYLSPEIMEKVEDVRGLCPTDGDLLVRLARSICPEIFGMEEVK
jgi:DNA replication licensing factor MCM7